MLAAMQFLRTLYKSKRSDPRSFVSGLSDMCRDEHRELVEYLLSPEELEPYFTALEKRTVDERSLYGQPFMVSVDSDIAKIPTIVSEQGLAYIPHNSDLFVQKLVEAGAVPFGKMPKYGKEKRAQQVSNLLSLGLGTFCVVVDDSSGVNGTKCQGDWDGYVGTIFSYELEDARIYACSEIDITELATSCLGVCLHTKEAEEKSSQSALQRKPLLQGAHERAQISQVGATANGEVCDSYYDLMIEKTALA